MQKPESECFIIDRFIGTFAVGMAWAAKMAVNGRFS